MLVTMESDIQLQLPDGSMKLVTAGDPFELPDDEAKARIEQQNVRAYSGPTSSKSTPAPAPTPEPPAAPATEDTK